jgi:hypothetical protein
MKPFVLALLLGVSPASAATHRTLTGKGLCRFEPPKGWRVTESWNAATPGAILEKKVKEGSVSISVTFFPEGNPEFPTLEAYEEQLFRPNFELEKSSAPFAAAELDGRPAELAHLELLDILWATMRVGQKKRILKDFIVAQYPGGFCSVGLSAPERAFPAERKEFTLFLKKFRLLVPKPAPPAASSVPLQPASADTAAPPADAAKTDTTHAPAPPSKK